MTMSRWEQVERLFADLVVLPVAQRQAVLDRECGDDPALRAELESLLAANDAASPLDHRPSLSPDEAPDESIEPFAARSAGPYDLLSVIAEGGMGTVWLAERRDGVPKRKVAVKLPHWSWMAGNLAERMARERDILAGLEHPNIARLYDAGVDEWGRPYLAMEYVEGRAIDVYVREKQLPVRDILGLVLQVANAVAHAHARLVIHRDLKPGNILVTVGGSVRLLDFGIARFLETDGQARTRLTQMAGRVLTLEYAAPEQIRGEGAGQTIGTAADVYSLGVVTYELLTGSTPYRIKRPSAAQLEEAIAKGDLRAPSEATDDPVRKRALRGDLDAILSRALKNEPAARYPSVEAFAQDIERYLAGEPVHARPDSALYRLGKFASRNRLALSAAGVIAMALIGATAVSLWQARVADAERNRALELLARHEAVSEFVNLMLTEVASPGEPITLDALLKRSEAMVYSGVTQNTEHQSEILLLLSQYYVSLGDAAKSETLLARAMDLTKQSHDVGLRARLACSHAFAISQLGQSEQAKATLAGLIDDSSIAPEVSAACLQQRAFIAQNTNDPAGALEYSQRAQTRLRESTRHDPALEASLLGDVGYAYQLAGRATDAERYFSLSLEKYRQIGRAEHPASVAVRNNWGMASAAAGDLKRALTLYEDAFNIAAKRTVDGEPPAYLIANRALALSDLAHYDQALKEYDRVVAVGERTNQPTLIVAGWLGKVKANLDRGDLDAAEASLAPALQLIGSAIPADSPSGMNSVFARARIDAGHGRFTSADAGLSKIVTFWESRKASNAALSSVLRHRADVRLQAGRLNEAAVDAHRALDIARVLQTDRPFSSHTGLSWLILSRVQLKQGQAADSKRSAEEAAKQLAPALGDEHPQTLRAIQLATDVT